MFVIVGWLICIVCVFGVFIIHGGNISVVLKALPFELITIGGATVGAFLVNNQMKRLNQAYRQADSRQPGVSRRVAPMPDAPFYEE